MRYTWRHDSVLTRIVEAVEILISNSENSKFSIFADLPGKLESTSPKSTIPEFVLDSYPCNQRPEIVLIRFNDRNEPLFCCLFELTVPFDDNILKRHQDKTNRYNNPNQPSLVSEINHHCPCKLIAFEIGCSGIITKGNKQRLREFLQIVGVMSSSSFKSFCYDLVKISIGASKKIFDCRNEIWDQNLPFYS